MAGLMSFSGSPITVGAPCGSKGGAMYDPPSHDPAKLPHGTNCFLMTGPPVIIGGTAMSVHKGCSHINMVFHVNGDQSSVPTALGLPGVSEA
jgi:hypothetical protein